MNIGRKGAGILAGVVGLLVAMPTYVDARVLFSEAESDSVVVVRTADIQTADVSDIDSRIAGVPLDIVNVIRGFYDALSRGDGAAAQEYLIEEKRNRGPYTVSSIETYFSNLSPRLRVGRISQNAGGKIVVEYSYGRAGGKSCSNRAVVTTVIRNGVRFIASIQASKDLCR
ncbi:hypothetical protein CCP2SC5_680017 [Azospirillaceae bacterium]